MTKTEVLACSEDEDEEDEVEREEEGEREEDDVIYIDIYRYIFNLI